jgi:hypothetical protein
MAENIRNYDIGDILVEKMKPGSNARKDPRESELLALGESLKVFQYHPVILDSEYMILDGWRRWLAARLVELKTLKAIITDRPLSSSELEIAQLTMSVHRASLTGGELYGSCFKLLQLNPGWLAKDLAGHLKLDPSMMTRILSPSKCILPVREALQAGKIGLSDCYAISKEPEERQRGMLEMKLRGASRDDLELHRRKRHGRRNGVIGRTPQARCPLPGGVAVVISAKVMSMQAIVGSLAEALKAAKKGCDDGYDVKTWEAMMRDRSKGA